MMDSTKTRLAIAGRIAAGICANPERYEGQSHEGEVAAAAWSIAGKLIRLAAAEHEAMDPEAVAGYAAKYAAKNAGGRPT